MKTKIPTSTIGLLSDRLPDYYTSTELDVFFMKAEAPESSGNNKSDKIINYLKAINKQCDEPLRILGKIIGELMDREPSKDPCSGDDYESDHDKKLRKDQEDIRRSLSENGLSYSHGGYVIEGGSAATSSLQEEASKWGLSSVKIEIDRALGEVESDSLAAVHRAGSVLESSCKAYLGHHNISYKETSDGLSDLWNKVVKHAGIHPQEMDEKDLKKIASGLFQIVDGTMHLRNKKSAAHGQSEDQMKRNTIKQRHARLVINAAHTVSLYVLELMGKG